MRRPIRISLAAVATSVAVILGVLLPSAAAQEPPTPDPGRDPSVGDAPGGLLLSGAPPAVGEVVLEDPLTAPGLIEAWRCPSGRNVGEFVGEGYIIKVTGSCSDTYPDAAITPSYVAGLDLPDGEVRLDVKVVSGHDRASFLLIFRGQYETQQWYWFSFVPARGWATLEKVADGKHALASRFDLRGRVASDDWNTLAVRLQGPNIWVLMNDEPILSAADPAFDRGSVAVGLFRMGDANDTAESAAVIRNLRVSRLAR